MLCGYSLDHVTAIQHGKINESPALNQLARQEKISIKRCGLFIDQECFILGASPDGMYDNDNAIIEIKCPKSAYGMIPNAYCSNMRKAHNQMETEKNKKPSRSQKILALVPKEHAASEGSGASDSECEMPTNETNPVNNTNSGSSSPVPSIGSFDDMDIVIYEPNSGDATSLKHLYILRQNYGIFALGGS
ncbi:unnamed protein product [Colias eurytheme]|nr:unnamed protein product [Colias eurytheme]